MKIYSTFKNAPFKRLEQIYESKLEEDMHAQLKKV
jgi:hypothetical protein